MPIPLQRRKNDGQQSAQAFAAYSVRCLPEHNQCRARRLIVKRLAKAESLESSPQARH